MKSVTYDETKYVLVPLIPTVDMMVDARVYNARAGADATIQGEYCAMLAAVPESLSGGSGEFRSVTGLYGIAHGTELFTHPTPDPAAIIRATIEAAANVCNEKARKHSTMFEHPDMYAADGCARLIRALSVEAILAGMEGK
jgi:hypothetical protein